MIGAADSKFYGDNVFSSSSFLCAGLCFFFVDGGASDSRPGVQILFQHTSFVNEGYANEGPARRTSRLEALAGKKGPMIDFGVYFPSIGDSSQTMNYRAASRAVVHFWRSKVSS